LISIRKAKKFYKIFNINSMASQLPIVEHIEKNCKSVLINLSHRRKKMKRFSITFIMTVIQGLLLVLIFGSAGPKLFSQQRDLEYYRPPDYRGINQFETSKVDTTPFNGVVVRVGGASTIQFQGINDENNAAFVNNGSGQNVNQLVDLSHNFNLPTANLDFDVQLAHGLRMHLRDYLSSRHHDEGIVKGGYLQIDDLDFISKGFLDDVMKVVTVKFGLMELDYGDAHFRRTDNAMALYNPFVGNYIMDAFTTEVGGEVYYKAHDIIAMIGASNGKLNQSVTDNGATNVAILGKLGFDKQINDDLRLRLTGSIYSNSKAQNLYLYGGDRAGSRYYSVMQGITATADNFTSGRWNPNFANKLTSVMVNGFMKYDNLELFGTIESANGGDTLGSSATRVWNQYALDAVYRFGASDNFYAGLRYNTASGKLQNDNPQKVTIDRVQAVLGWFLTKNVLTKLEYVDQSYNHFPYSSIYSNGRFYGYVLEASITF
jgi:hypothetical protein